LNKINVVTNIQEIYIRIFSLSVRLASLILAEKLKECARIPFKTIAYLLLSGTIA